MNDVLLEVQDLKTHLPLEEGVLKAVDASVSRFGAVRRLDWLANLAVARAWRYALSCGSRRTSPISPVVSSIIR